MRIFEQGAEYLACLDGVNWNGTTPGCSKIITTTTTTTTLAPKSLDYTNSAQSVKQFSLMSSVMTAVVIFQLVA